MDSTSTTLGWRPLRTTAGTVGTTTGCKSFLTTPEVRVNTRKFAETWRCLGTCLKRLRWSADWCPCHLQWDSDKHHGPHMPQNIHHMPAPKHNKPSNINDSCSVSLTAAVMKMFERLVKDFIPSWPFILLSLNPIQITYRPDRSI